MAPKIYEKHQEIELQYDESLSGIFVNGSEFLLEILLRNLIDNASRYSPKGGEIKVSVINSEGDVVLSIEDSGPGVPEKDFDKLTERFYRLHQNQNSGTGLGLSLVNAIASFHDGHLSFYKSKLGGLGIKVSFSPSS